MAVFAVYIEKSVNFQGGARVFGNTYHFATDAAEGFPDETVAIEVANAERAITFNDINFVGWRTWGPTDGPEIDNVMREEGSLSGTGTAGTSVGLFREVCVLVSWPLPRSVPLNRRRWLRKFIRSGTGNPLISTAQAQGASPLTAAQKQSIIDNYASVVTSVGALEGIQLSNEQGVEPNGPPFVGDFLITRQIGR